MPLNTPLPANLPTTWTYGQIIAPTGQEVGLPANYGYNYLMNQVNNAQKAALELEDKKADLDMSNLNSPSSALYNLGAKPNENLLDNWYFVGGGLEGKFPINQRGKTKYTTTGGICDRWVNSESYHVDLTENGLNTGSLIRQIHEEWKESEWAGKVMTASVLFAGDGGLSTYTFTYPGSSENGKESPDGVIKIGRLQGFGWNQPSFGINVDYKPIVAAKLEFGGTQTLARKTENGWALLETPHYVNELLKCQRYFERIYVKNGLPCTRCKENELSFSIQMAVPKRLSAPTITPQEMYVTRFSDDAGVYGAFVKKTPVCVSHGTNIVVNFQDNWTNAVNVGDAAYIGGDTYIDVSAEL